MKKTRLPARPAAINSELKIAWATWESAAYACKHWHYSRSLPAFKTAQIGVWENEIFKGVIIFSIGAIHRRGLRYGLNDLEVVELARIALRNHDAEVSRILAISVRMIKREFKNLRLILSFADPEQGHIGTVYQASGWIFTGISEPENLWVKDGRRYHNRTAIGKFGKKRHLLGKEKVQGKYRYLLPLDDDMKCKLLPLSQPYPKRAGSRENAAPGFQPGEDGANPIPALQSVDLTNASEQNR